MINFDELKGGRTIREDDQIGLIWGILDKSDFYIYDQYGKTDLSFILFDGHNDFPCSYQLGKSEWDRMRYEGEATVWVEDEFDFMDFTFTIKSRG